jgi:multiple sugar transport system substrate-binding protein
LAVSAIAAGVLLAAGALGAQAATARHAGSVSITVWSGLSGPDETGILNIVNGFNKQQNGVTVNYRTAPFSNYYNDLATTLSHNTGTPNLFTAPAANLSYLSQQGTFDKLVKGNPVLNAKNFTHGLWKYYEWDGHQYSIPLYAVPYMEYYNKSLIKKPVLSPPSKVISTAKKLTKHGVYGMVFPGGQWPMPFLWPTLVNQFGGTLYNAKTKTCLEASPAAVNALYYMWNVIFKLHLSPKSYAVNQDLSMLASGTAAQIFDGIWEYTNTEITALGKNLGISAVPQWGPHYKVFVGDLGWSINKKNSAKENKAVIKFLEYYEKNSNKMAAVGDVPVYVPVLNKVNAHNYPAAFAAKAELDHAYYSPKAVGLNDGPVYSDALYPVTSGQDIKPGSEASVKAQMEALLAKGNNVCTQGVRHPSG